MVNQPVYTPAQLRVLKAAAEGRVTQAGDGTPWRVSAPGSTITGSPVTQTAESLIRRGLARKSGMRNDQDRVPLVVTADGYELLSKVGRRAAR